MLKEQPKVLVQDWFKDRQTQLKVQRVIEDVLDQDLPESCELNLFKEKSLKIFDLVFNYSEQKLKWVS